MSKVTRGLKRIGNGIWAAILYIWNRPIIIIALLLVAAYFLFNEIIAQSFRQYTNCNYLIVTRLGMDPLFCNGHVVTAMGIPILTIPGLRDVMDPPLELARTGAAWGVLVFLAFISLFLTILVNNFKAVVRILTFQREEWSRLLAGVRVWLLIFVIACSIFYFSVIR